MKQRTPLVEAVDEPWANRAHVVADAWFDADGWRAACGVVVHGERVPARWIDADRRCGANGCRNRWPAALRAVS